MGFIMAGGVSKSQLRIEGTTLWLTQKNTDVIVRTGNVAAPSSSAASETRLKLSRVFAQKARIDPAISRP
jgi:hypothetical protein